MKESLTEILKAKMEWKNFFISLALGLLFASLLYILLIPLTYWGLFGEGETASNIMDKPLNSFILEYGTLALILFIYGTLAFSTYRNEKFSKTKSFILAGIIIFAVYMFRFEIGNASFDIRIK
jgi:hypothetical protein